MRIVINAFSARLGGGQTYLINLLAHLPRQGIEIFIYAPAQLALPADPRIVRLQTRWPTTNPLARALWEKIALPRVLARLRADVLFCPGGVVGSPVPAGVRVVTMFRNMIPFDMAARRAMPLGLQRVRNAILARVMIKSMSDADLVIFISDFARGIIERRTGPLKAVTIAHGIADQFRLAPGGSGAASPFGAGDYLLYVSRFDTYKHHDQLLLAYAQLPAALRARHRLVLVGESDTPCGERARALVAEHGLQEQVEIAGAVDYNLLPAVYRNAKAILFSSSCENCPNILLESLAAGRPVLCSSVMPMPEFGAEAVLYYDPRQAAQIRDRLLEVLGDDGLAADLGRRAALRSERYGWAATAAATWDSILALKAT